MDRALTGWVGQEVFPVVYRSLEPHGPALLLRGVMFDEDREFLVVGGEVPEERQGLAKFVLVLGRIVTGTDTEPGPFQRPEGISIRKLKEIHTATHPGARLAAKASAQDEHQTVIEEAQAQLLETLGAEAEEEPDGRGGSG